MNIFRYRKGQSATEYLMTYGWAILAITIVGALLYTQVFSNKSCTTSTTFSVDSGVVPVAQQYVIETDGSVRMLVKNNLDKNVTITGVSGDSGSNTTLNIVVPPGQTATVDTVTNVAGAGESGKCYSEQISITYDVSGGLSNMKSTGVLNGKYV